MKKIIMIFALLFIFISPMHHFAAEEKVDFGPMFIRIGEAIMVTKASDWTGAETAITELKLEWEKITKTGSKEEKDVIDSLLAAEKALNAKDQKLLLEKLSNLSNALLAYDKKLHPVDVEAKRQEFKTAITPVMTSLEGAIATKDEEELNIVYKRLSATWTKKEKIVREQSIDYYGQIETKMGFLRIAITKDVKDYSEIERIYSDLSQTINDFIDGKETKQVSNQNHSVQTLVDLLEKALKSIDNGEPEQATTSLEEFLTVWPSVEGEIQTRNGGLYTELENNIPILAGKLSSKNTDLEEIKAKIQQYLQEISLIEKKQYSVWDAALIMLREGLEALLIVAALIAFLKKMNATKEQKWIWIGAGLGVVMSVVAAIIINTIFSAAMAGANREIIEGATGIIAVLMMLGVGIWLHNKSNINAWNKYINSQMGKALSTGSVLSMAFISFLSIFREGAETIIFYTGMAPSISTEKLLTGIGIAILILVGFAFVFIKFSTKIPLGPFFKVATVLIYALAFKILGVSLHALQLTNVISTNLIKDFPVIDLIGFFPTWETLLPQLLLIGTIILTMVIVETKHKKTTISG
ncbi:FTR1 family iron permease [Bacillus marasmi]|uniref:FTR1 family iron permease n=1 Tax=Bacillus marasmi TaxID=1926279 RepID=UPI0011C815E9|nr:FTR1 family protein [Bacillus marasmi]